MRWRSFKKEARFPGTHTFTASSYVLPRIGDHNFGIFQSFGTSHDTGHRRGWPGRIGCWAIRPYIICSSVSISTLSSSVIEAFTKYWDQLQLPGVVRSQHIISNQNVDFYLMLTCAASWLETSLVATRAIVALALSVSFPCCQTSNFPPSTEFGAHNNNSETDNFVPSTKIWSTETRTRCSRFAHWTKSPASSLIFQVVAPVMPGTGVSLPRYWIVALCSCTGLEIFFKRIEVDNDADLEMCSAPSPFQLYYRFSSLYRIHQIRNIA